MDTTEITKRKIVNAFRITSQDAEEVIERLEIFDTSYYPDGDRIGNVMAQEEFAHIAVALGQLIECGWICAPNTGQRWLSTNPAHPNSKVLMWPGNPLLPSEIKRDVHLGTWPDILEENPFTPLTILSYPSQYLRVLSNVIPQTPEEREAFAFNLFGGSVGITHNFARGGNIMRSSTQEQTEFAERISEVASSMESFLNTEENT